MKTLKYILHGFKKNIVRTLLAVLSVFFMFTMMVVISMFFSSAQETDFDSVNRDVAFDIQIVRSGHTDLDPHLLNVSSVEGRMGSFSSVTGVYPMIRGYGFSMGEDEPSHFYSLYGVSEDYDIGVVDSSMGEYDLEWGSCVISTKASYSLGEIAGVDRIGVGDSFDLMVPSPGGIRNTTLRVAGIYEISGRYTESISFESVPYIVVGLDYLQNLTDLEGKATQIMVTVDQDLYDLSDPSNPSRRVERLAGEIAGDLGERYDVTAPKAEALASGTTGFLSSLSYLFAILLPAISGILVASVMNLSVEEKTQEIATLRLLGAKRNFVGKVVVSELFTILILGAVPALIVGPLIANAIVFVFGLDFSLSSLQMSLQLTLQIIIAIVVSVLFSLSPIIKALRTNPSESVNRVKSQGTFRYISNERVDRKLVFSGWFVFGSMMIAIFSVVYLVTSPGDETICFSSIFLMTLLPVSLSIALLGGVPYMEDLITRIMTPFTRKTNKIIRSNIKRNVRRNISTNLIFGTIVAILVMFSSIFSSFIFSSTDMIRDSIGSDIRVFMFDSGLGNDDIEIIREIEGVSVVSGLSGPTDMRVSDIILKEERSVFAYGIDNSLTDAIYSSRARFDQGGAGDLRSLGERGVAISKGLSSALDVDRGESISVIGDEGSRKLFFEVRAVITQFPGFLGQISDDADTSFHTALVSLEGYGLLKEENLSDLTFSSLFIEPENDDAVGSIMDRLNERFGTSEEVFIINTEETIEMSTMGIVVLNTIMTVISVLLLIVAIFSLVINLYASVKEREYGIGVLKSIGLRNGQVLGSLMVEGIVIAMVSMLLGLVSGIAVAYIGVYAFNAISLVTFDFYPPWIIIIVLSIFTIGFGALGSLFPALTVSRKEIINLMKRIE